jgi:hypothetical protein
MFGQPQLSNYQLSDIQNMVEHWVFIRGSLDKSHVAVCQNLVPRVNIKIAGKWMFIPLKMVLIGIDP